MERWSAALGSSDPALARRILQWQAVHSDLEVAGHQLDLAVHRDPDLVLGQADPHLGGRAGVVDARPAQRSGQHGQHDPELQQEPNRLVGIQHSRRLVVDRL